MNDTEKLVETLKSLCKDNLEKDALYLTESSIYDYINAGLYENLDYFLELVHLEDFKKNPNVILTILNCTISFKTFLKLRESFADKCILYFDEVFGTEISTSLMEDLV